MTLCIAAECRPPAIEAFSPHFHNVVIFATDFQVEAEVARAEIGKKYMSVGREEFPVLLAGASSRAAQLGTEISLVLEENSAPIGAEYVPPRWGKTLNEAIRRQKARIAGEIVAGRFGITYDHFLSHGKAQLSADAFDGAMLDIERATLDCYLAVIAFNLVQPHIFRTHPSGTVERCENFAAIGSGYYIAESALYQRNQSDTESFERTLYNVYEAMRLGSHAPGVGEKFMIGVARWEFWDDQPTNEGSIQISHIDQEYYAYLEGLFKQYGPRRVDFVELKEEFIHDQEMEIMLTPKGMHQEEMKKRARSAKRSASRKSKGQQ